MMLCEACKSVAVHIVHEGSKQIYLCNEHMMEMLQKKGALDLQTIKGKPFILPGKQTLTPSAEHVLPPITKLTALEELRVLYMQTEASLGQAFAGRQVLTLCGAIIKYLENQERERASH